MYINKALSRLKAVVGYEGFYAIVSSGREIGAILRSPLPNTLGYPGATKPPDLIRRGMVFLNGLRVWSDKDRVEAGQLLELGDSIRTATGGRKMVVVLDANKAAEVRHYEDETAAEVWSRYQGVVGFSPSADEVPVLDGRPVDWQTKISHVQLLAVLDLRQHNGQGQRSFKL